MTRSAWGAAAVLLVAASVPVVAGAPPAAADTTITPTVTYDRTDPDDGELSLREAVALANETAGPDTVELAPGATYVIGGTCNYEETDTDPALVVTDAAGLVIDGHDATIRQVGPGGGFCEPRVIRNGTGPLELRGVTITGGDAPVVCTDHPNCIPSPTYGLGGGIHSEGPVVLDEHASVRGNRADRYGGGIESTSTVELRDRSSVSDNTAGVGGGVHAADGVTLTSSWVQGNRAVLWYDGPFNMGSHFGAGGGIATTGAVTATDAVVSDNVAEAVEGALVFDPARGGGILAGSVTLEDTLVSGNEAQGVFNAYLGHDLHGQGGGVRADTITLVHASVFANDAGDGAQLSGRDLAATASMIGGDPDAVSCTLTGATTSGGYNVVGGGTCGLGDGTGDRTHVPFPVGVPNGDRPLRNGVLSIIPPADCGTDPDRDGDPRPSGGACEAGADEVVGAAGPHPTPTSIIASGLADVPGNRTDAVDWATTHRVLTGSGGSFRPDATVTRGQAVAALWRMFGSPRVRRTGLPYVDVPRGAAYRPALKWALDADVLDATSGARFRPKDPVDRATFVSLLWRAGGSIAVLGGAFADLPTDAPAWAAANWAVNAGIVATPGHRFHPRRSVRRGDAAQLFYLAASSPRAWHQVDPPRDVTPPPTNNL